MGDIVAKLKLNLREDLESPFFTDEQLYNLLEKADNDLKKASYLGCIEKAENDSLSLSGSINIPSNRRYWLSLAKTYKQNGSRFL